MDHDVVKGGVVLFANERAELAATLDEDEAEPDTVRDPPVKPRISVAELPSAPQH